MKMANEHSYKDVNDKIKAARKESTAMSRAALEGMIVAAAGTIPTVLFFGAAFTDFMNNQNYHAINSAIWGTASGASTAYVIKRVYSALKQKENSSYNDRVIVGQHDGS